jgi:hypothetical protein
VWRMVEFRAAPRARSGLDLGRVVWAAGQVFSFEAAFLLFIFSPAYKIDPALRGSRVTCRYCSSA